MREQPEPEWRTPIDSNHAHRSGTLFGIGAIDLFSLQRSGMIGGGADMLPVGPTGRQVEPATVLCAAKEVFSQRKFAIL